MRYKCKKCGDILEPSKVRYDMRYCSCKSLGVDNLEFGGCRVVGSFEWVELVGEEE